MEPEDASRVSAAAALFADRARAGMLISLAESGPSAVTDLARVVGVSLGTASAHLTKLAESGFVTSTRAGRLRIYRLSGPRVTRAVEALADMVDRPARFPSDSLSMQSARSDEVARFCYDHLAGRLGVRLTDTLVQNRLISRRAWSYRPTKTGGYGLTRAGREFFGDLGINTAALRTPGRSFAHPCLDRTERRPHVAGALGAAVASRFLELAWVERLPRTRALRLTPAGHAALRKRFGFEL